MPFEALINEIYIPMQYPSHCFPEAPRKLIEGMEEVVGSRPEFAGLGILFFGSLISAKVKIRIKGGWDLPTNLYCAVVAPKGEAKSPALKFAIGPIVKFFSNEAVEYHENFRAWEKKLVDAKMRGKSKANLDDIARIEAEAPKMPWWGLITDGTVEGIQKASAENHEHNHPMRMGKFSEELDGWISNLSRYSDGSDSAFYLEAFDGTAHIKANKGEKSASPPMTLSIIGTIQDEIFSGCFTGQNTENGLLDRMMVASPVGPQPESDPWSEWDESVLANYRRWAEAFIYSLPQKQTLEYTQECREIGTAFFQWAKKMDSVSGAGASSKWWQQYHKVVAILTVLWRKERVDEEICQKASELTRFHVSCWTRSFKAMRKSDIWKAEERILKRIKEKPAREMTYNQALKLFDSSKRFCASQALKTLTEEGRLLERVFSSKNGKESVVLSLPVSEDL